MKLRVIIALSSAALLTLALALVSTAGPTCLADADSDGVCDDVATGGDNCLGASNPAQRDDDEDGYGNQCDADVNQDCGVGTIDLGLVFGAFGGGNPWSPKSDGRFDINEDNGTGTIDLGLIFGGFGQPVGPSSRPCADCTAALTPGLGLGVCP